MTSSALSSAVSDLGSRLPSAYVNDGTVLIAMKAYLDGSGGKGTEFLVLSGVAADDSAWKGFDDKWRQILDSQPLKPKYLHMHEVCNLKEEYKAKNGWTEALANKVVTDCLMYAQNLDKKAFRVFTCHLDMEEHRRIQAEGNLIPDCHELCVHFSPVRILKWYVERFNEVFPQELHYYFDQNERFKGRFEQRWIRGKKSGKGLSTHWHLIKTVATVDMKDTPAVQLADLCAWAYHRRLMKQKHGLEGLYGHLADIAEGILPNDRKILDKDGLRYMSSFNNIHPQFFSDQYGFNK